MNIPLRRPITPKRRRIGKRHLLAGAAIVVVILAWIVSGTGMAIRSVSVSGNRNLSAAEIIRMAGLPGKAPLSRSAARAVRARLMRHPAFQKVAVSRHLGGTLSIKVVERSPACWLVSRNCAVSRDGVLLPHVPAREPEWILVDGLGVEHGCVRDAKMLAEAANARIMTADIADAEGVWRRVESRPPCWEWILGKRKVTFSSPPCEDEVERLRVFKAEFPDAWRGACGLDLRFQDRVVIKR